MAVTKVNHASTKPHHGMPTHAQLCTTYRHIIESRQKSGGLHKMTKPPKDFAKYPAYNITPKGKLGANETVYVIKGEMYLETHVVAPNAKSSWYKAGPAPMF